MTPTSHTAPSTALVVLDVGAKSALLFAMAMVAVDPEWGNLEGKAPVARAIIYPMGAFVLPAAWLAFRWTPRFPFAPDLLITLICFSDVLGNRLDFYDTVEWFDDWVHLADTGLLAAAVVLLTTTRSTGCAEVVVRAVGVGITAALAWELFEYFSFVTRSDELPTAYADTLIDLMMGWLGAVSAAIVVHVVRRQLPEVATSGAESGPGSLRHLR